VGEKLRDFWKLEEHTLGETTFTHYPNGTGHKNRMQGNDFFLRDSFLCLPFLGVLCDKFLVLLNC
jgi:hypothetical protein